MIQGINWFGFETDYRNLMCSWSHPIEWHLDRIQELEFNYIRLPFSLDYIEENDFSKMDEFFDLTEQKNISVLLDFHRLENTHQSPVPWNDKYSFDEFLYGWETILERYENYSVLKAVDIYNEYQGDNFVEWNSVARQIVNFIEARFSNRFDYFVGCVSWGGNCHDMDLSDLSFFNRITYTVHKYWFSDNAPREEKWDYSIKQPVMVGEWGYISSEENQANFAEEFVGYLIDRDIRNTFFWTWSWNSGDTGGVLKEDCESVDWDKMNLLRKLWGL